jgi:acid phosphatase
VKFDYLVMILMENHNLTDIYNSKSAPYMTGLANTWTLLQDYTAVDHPSEPNYQALMCGQTNNPPSGDDLYHVFNVTNVVDRLESKGLTWRAYSESAAGPCDKTNPDIRHVPFIFYQDVETNAARCNRIIPTTAPTDAEVIAELNSSSPSNFIWITPNDQDNMHSAAVSVGDNYLKGLVPNILSSATFKNKRAALFIVFDEGNLTYPMDYVYAVWAGPAVKTATKLTTPFTHYSVLATMEANWGLTSITANDKGATSMMSVFQ